MIFRIGLLGLAAAVLLLLQALYSWVSGIAVSGWTSLTVVVLFFGSTTLLSLGVLGAYLAQIFDEIKRRPEFLIQAQLGTQLPAGDSSPFKGEAGITSDL